MIGIITVSDTRSVDTDASGPAILGALEALGYTEFEARLVPDELEPIRQAILELSGMCEAVFTTGGTGFTSRDVTPEATAPILERQAPNLVELMRLKGLERTPMSHLTRGLAGTRGKCLIVNLPGSPKGAREGIEALAPLLPHIFEQITDRGGGHPC
ncbi:MAG TPA: MogA/MoaB family molybdenum cofactor biosynthesis protein [Fimbriimonadaceae bacterium]|nr:MogA/MoaB family molybdenum cofactor biosynthesis protein [Fimbriimonadaceae bacterium]